MSSTNKTINYELSQYIGSDKPTYLGDYNSDMLKIDTQMKRNSDDIASANAGVTTAQSTANSAQSTANSAQSTADSASTTATSALNKALANETNISYLLSLFNLTNITQFAYTELIAVQNISNFTVSSLAFATNSESSVYKLYGTLTFNASATGLFKIKIPTSLRPTASYRVNSAGIVRIDSSNGVPSNAYFDVDTNGDIVITGYTNAIGTNQLYLFPCIYFNKNFGDVEE